jgi:hypothetical protein
MTYEPAKFTVPGVLHASEEAVLVSRVTVVKICGPSADRNHECDKGKHGHPPGTAELGQNHSTLPPMTLARTRY